MCKQPVPQITDKDVKRIALRDFGESQLLQVISILDEFGKQEWNSPGARVRLAILKLANGDLDKLMDHTKVAIEDFRDALSAIQERSVSMKLLKIINARLLTMIGGSIVSGLRENKPRSGFKIPSPR
jgi:hypothetical protein